MKTDPPEKLAFAPDGLRLLLHTFSKGAVVLDPTSGSPLCIFAANVYNPGELQNALWSDDGTRVVTTAYAPRRARVWSIPSQEECLERIRASNRAPVLEPQATLGISAWPDDSASLGPFIVTAKSLGPLVISSFEPGTPPLRQHLPEGGASSLAVAKTAGVVVTASGSVIRMWSLGPEGLQSIRGLRADMRVERLAVSPDARFLAAITRDNPVQFWNLSDPPILARTLGRDPSLPRVRPAFSPTGSRLATAHGNGVICVWDTETGDRLHTLHTQQDPVASIAWSPDGRHLAFAGGEPFPSPSVKILRVGNGA